MSFYSVKENVSPENFSTEVAQGSRTLGRAATGLEAGVIGGIAMFALLALFSVARGRGWWESPNLLSSTFYGPRALSRGIGMPTISGWAFHLVITGTLGCLFGISFGSIRQRGRLVLLGLVTGLGWYALTEWVLWPLFNPLIPVYSFTPALLFGHLVYGLCLGYLGQSRHEALAG